MSATVQKQVEVLAAMPAAAIASRLKSIEPAESAVNHTLFGRRVPKRGWLRPLFKLCDVSTAVAAEFPYFVYRRQPRSRPYLLAPVIGWFIRTPIRFSIRRKMRLLMSDQGWDAAREREFWRQHLRHVGFNVLEPEQLWRKPAAEIRELVSLEGEEHLRTAKAAGRGMFVFINHVGPSSCVPLLARFGYDITVAGDAMLVPHLERKLQFMFREIGAHRVLLGDRVPHHAVEVFRRNGIFATYTDLTTAARHTDWLPFGPAEIRVPCGPAVLALRHRVPVLYVDSIRLSNQRYRIVVHPPLDLPAEGDLSANTRTLMLQACALLLKAARARPEQWWALDYVRLRAPLADSPSPASLVG